MAPTKKAKWYRGPDSLAQGRYFPEVSLRNDMIVVSEPLGAIITKKALYGVEPEHGGRQQARKVIEIWRHQAALFYLDTNSDDLSFAERLVQSHLTAADEKEAGLVLRAFNERLTPRHDWDELLIGAYTAREGHEFSMEASHVDLALVGAISLYKTTLGDVGHGSRGELTHLYAKGILNDLLDIRLEYCKQQA
jgi:hypothetical protein